MEEEGILENFANSDFRMDQHNHQRPGQWLTPEGLVNIARVEVIDPTWSGTDEPEH